MDKARAISHVVFLVQYVDKIRKYLNLPNDVEHMQI